MTYPPIAPFSSGHLTMPDGAEIYWEASGNPDGEPALWLHGGPGSGLGRGGYRRHFDPVRYLVIGIDQRGSGRSRPVVTEFLGTLSAQTTQRLIDDIEVVRVQFGFDQWVVAGVSWGTTLALAYALAHPDRVRALGLVAVTTTSREEVEWITEGVGRIFPEAWNEFRRAARLRPGERIVDAYARRMASADRDDRREAALAWDIWEGTHVSLDSPETRGEPHSDPQVRDTFATLVTHYWSNDGFLTGENAILPHIGRIGHLPAVLIHGRRDVSGPADTAWKLHQSWPNSELIIVEDEAHGGEQEMAHLAHALDRFAGGERPS